MSSRKHNLVPQIEAVSLSTVVTLTAATPITIQADTVMIEVIAKNGAICIRNDGTAGLTTGTFKYKVPDGAIRQFPVTAGAPQTYSFIGESASVELTLTEYKSM